MVEADCVSDTSAPSTPTIAAAPAHFVRVVLSLPLSRTSFTADKQAQLKEAIAAAAGVSSNDVTIEKIEDVASATSRCPQLLKSVVTLSNP